MVEANRSKVICCQQKSSIHDLVQQTASHLISVMQLDDDVTILGKAATLSKAVSVCEIVKRKFGDDVLE